MSILDHLKDQSQRQRGGAVSADAMSSDFPDSTSGPFRDQNTLDAVYLTTGAPVKPISSEAVVAAERASVSTTYYADWIERLEKAQTLPPPQAEAFLKNALQQAPSRSRPPSDDARMFALAGGSILLFQDVADWLKLRWALQEATGDIMHGKVPPEVARYWLRELGSAEHQSASQWVDHCRRVADAAIPVGMGLDPRLVAGLQTHPAWARAYLHCGSVKTRLGETHRWVKRGVKPEPDPGKGNPEAPSRNNAGTGHGETTNSAATANPPSGPAKKSASWREIVPVSTSSPLPLENPTGTPFAAGIAPGTGVGLALGGWAGGFVRGVVGGWKTAVNQAFAQAARVTTMADGCGESEPLVHARVADAERALAALIEKTQRLQRHPTLAAFWRVVDQQARIRFAGDRAAVFQDMARRSTHPLRAMFERQRRADPDLARCYAQVHVAFEALHRAWETGVQMSPPAARWTPSPEQIETLRAACRHVPPDSEHPALIDRVERLLQVLTQTVRHAFAGSHAPAHDPSPAP